MGGNFDLVDWSTWNVWCLTTFKLKYQQFNLVQSTNIILLPFLILPLFTPFKLTGGADLIYPLQHSIIRNDHLYNQGITRGSKFRWNGVNFDSMHLRKMLYFRKAQIHVWDFSRSLSQKHVGIGLPRSPAAVLFCPLREFTFDLG